MSNQATLDSIYECTPRQTAQFVEDCIYAGLVPFVKSSPGMGKSSIMRQVADKLELQLIDHRLSTSEPTDMNGLPRFTEDGKAAFMPFEELFPLEGISLPKDKQGWMLFLDEANSATKAVQAASYKLILDRMVGQHRLHEFVAPTMAGNHDTDGAITTRIGTALQSRVVHIKMRTDFKEWLEDVATPQQYDPRIIAYLNWKPSSLNDFKPDHKNDTFCCQRTWEFMNRLIKDQEITDAKTPLYVGTISPGVAVDFVQFTKVYASLPDIRAIINDPMSASIPQDTATRWAVTMKLATEADETTFGPLAQYMDRFGIENRILFYRTAIAGNAKLHSHPTFIKAMVALSQYLNPQDRQLKNAA